MKLSRRTLTRMMELLETVNTSIVRYNKAVAARRKITIVVSPQSYIDKFWSRKLFEHGVEEWVITTSEKLYQFKWDQIIRKLEGGQFFVTEWTPQLFGVLPEEEEETKASFLGKVAAILVVGDLYPGGPSKGTLEIESLIRSLEHDGFAVDTRNVRLIPAEGPISHEEEENRLKQLVKTSGLTNPQTITMPLDAAIENLLVGTPATDHASLGESRTLFQAVINGVCERIDKSGRATCGLPGPMANRLEYLEKHCLIVADERTMLGMAWGFLSAGSHPGTPSRELARIGLLFSMELSQLLILKLQFWRDSNDDTGEGAS